MTEVKEADKRSAINVIIRRHLRGTPMEGLENEIENCEVDPLLILAIGSQESQLGKSYAQYFNNEYHNPFGLSDRKGLIRYNSWQEAIKAECKLLTRLIVEKGAKTLNQIGFVYAIDNNWPNNVESFYLKLWEELENL